MLVPQLAEYFARLKADNQWNAAMSSRELERKAAMARQILVVKGFLESKLDLVVFRQKMEEESGNHNLWGFSGFSGQKFLNMLVKYGPDPPGTTRAVREAISVPKDLQAAAGSVDKFTTYIGVLNERIKPHWHRPAVGYCLYFQSYFWNILRPGSFPIYFPTAVDGLDKLRVVDLSEVDDLPVRYETYVEWMDKVRADCNSLLGRDSYAAAEDILLYVTVQLRGVPQSTDASVEPPEASEDVPDPEREDPGGDPSHTEIQGMLARIGKLRGYKVHIASNDRNRTWDGTTLGSIGGDEFPLPGYEPEQRKHIELIDVIWFKGKEIKHVFEVEKTTNVYGGLLRMSDLLALQPGLRPHLAIVAPSEREREVRRVMSRPTFARMKDEGNRQFEFKSFDGVRKQYSAEQKGDAIH